MKRVGNLFYNGKSNLITWASNDMLLGWHLPDPCYKTWEHEEESFSEVISGNCDTWNIRKSDAIYYDKFALPGDFLV